MNRLVPTLPCLLVILCAFATTAQAADPVPTALPAAPGGEAEPNDSTATASPIAAGERIRAQLYPTGEVDRYRFTAEAGDRVFAATVGQQDSLLTLLGSDGTTVIESDDDDGSLGRTSSSIAGAAIPATGTYYLEVGLSGNRATLGPYELWLDVRSGAPVPEAEPNDDTATATPLPGGFAAGTHDVSGEPDWYALELGAGDTVFLSLDLDPDRDGDTHNGRLGFGTAPGPVVTVDESGRDAIGSESYAATVPAAATYYVRVDDLGGPELDYHLSATVIPAVQRSCRTYTTTASTAIPDRGTATIPIDVADAATIDRVALAVDVTHGFMPDLDATLQPPGGTELPLFTDIGSRDRGVHNRMTVLFDDHAAAVPNTPDLESMALQPDFEARLSYLSGRQAGGTWNLRFRDDALEDSGTFASADLILCAKPEREAVEDTVFSAGFESGDDGFTHSGTGDEWEHGVPATAQAGRVAPLASCGEGARCFKTDLDGSYEPRSSQDLVSPPISLAGHTGPIYASWAMWFQMEETVFDHASVSVEEDGGGNARPLFTWVGADMFGTLGTPPVTVPFAAGWDVHRADISEYAGRTIRLRFHLDSDENVQAAGLAIDDVRVFQEAFALGVAIAGSGSGYVQSAPAAIDCGSDTAAHPTCSAAQRGEVTLTAHPDAGSTFAGFTGAGCSGAAATCTVTLDRTRDVTATFEDLPDDPAAPSGATPSGSAAPDPVALAEPAISRLRLASRCVRRSASGRVRVPMTVRLARPGALQVRIDRAVGSTGRSSCPKANPVRDRSTRFRPVTTRAVAAALTRRVTLDERLTPGLYRISVRVRVDGNRLSPPVRRFLRVVG